MDGTKLSGLWKNKSKNGKPYMTGNIGLAKLLVLPNDFKEKETDPDYFLFAVPKENPKPAEAEAEKGSDF